jgi:4-amino-4-deoxy-L-arabinose transferase-like glycosyltransferase
LPDHSHTRIFALALLVCAGFLLLNRRGHVDDGDAQVYQVVARHMAEDHAWLDLRYLPSVFPKFREHLPFGFWPSAATIRVFGEGALVPLSVAWSLGTLLLTGWIGFQLAGAEVGAFAMLILGTTASFFESGSRPRLDPPLLFFATAAAAPILVAARARRQPGEGATPLPSSAWLLAGLLGAVAALIKGPFGVVPLAAAVLARARIDRASRTLFIGVGCVVLAALPAVLFLTANHLSGDDSWWVGYMHDQILASASGVRTDGVSAWWYPLRTLAGRFWPGIPILGVGLVVAARGARSQDTHDAAGPGAIRLFGFCSLFTIATLCVPTRKVWNHALVAYPFLSLFAAATWGPLLSRLCERRPRLVVAVLGATATAVWIGAVSGLGAKTLPEPCVVSREFATALAPLPPGTPVLVVAAQPDWRLIAELACERRLNPAPSPTWTAPPGPAPEWAIVSAESEAPPEGWSEVRRARGLRLLTRR